MCILAHLMMPHQLCSFFIILFFFLLLKLDNLNWLSAVQFSSVAQSCLTLCDPMNCSPPGLQSITNSWGLSKLMSIESVMPSDHLILCRPLFLLPSIFPSMGSFQMSQLFALGGQSIGVSASTSVLPMTILRITDSYSACSDSVELFWRTFHFIFYKF